MQLRAGSHRSQRRVVVALAAALALGGGLTPQHVAEVAAQGYTPEGRVAYANAKTNPSETDFSRAVGIHTLPRVCEGPCEERRLTTDSGDSHPVWDPGGRRLAFTREWEADFEPQSAIFILDLPSGDVTRLTPSGTSADFAAWSPDGTSVAFSGGARMEDETTVSGIGIIKASGGTVYWVPDYQCPPGSLESMTLPVRTKPTFSADGQHLAYEVRTVHPGGARRPGEIVAAMHAPPASVPVAPLSSMAGCDSAWGWGTMGSDHLEPTVWVSSTSGHADEQPVGQDLWPACDPAWSPDGAHIAVNTQGAMYLVSVDGGPNISIPYRGGLLFSGCDRTYLEEPRIAWDPAGEFLTNTMDLQPQRYKPDGSGVLDTPDSYVTAGWSIQCVPGSCLTGVSIAKVIAEPGGTYPVDFSFTGDAHGTITVADPSGGSLFTRMRAGSKRISETPTAGWELIDIECDQPHQSDLAGSSVSFDLEEGVLATCTFTNRSIAGQTPTPAPTPTARPTPTPNCGSGGQASHGASDLLYGARFGANAGNPDIAQFGMLVNFCYDGRKVVIDRSASYTHGDSVWPPWLVYAWSVIGVTLNYEDQGLSIEPLSDGSAEATGQGKFSMCFLPLPGAGGAAKLLGKVFKLVGSRLPSSVKTRLLKALLAGLERALNSVADFFEGKVGDILETLVGKLADKAASGAGFSGCFFPLWYVKFTQRFFPDGHFEEPIDDGAGGLLHIHPVN